MLWRQRGSMTVIVAAGMMSFIAFAALTIDLGYLYMTRTEGQIALEVGSLAALEGLSTDVATARTKAQNIMSKNLINGKAATIEVSNITVGNWNHESHEYLPLEDSEYAKSDAVKIRVEMLDSNDASVGMFFSRLFGHSTHEMSFEQVATFRPRDVVLSLDFSGSMNNDSILSAMDSMLTQDDIEANILQMWQESGIPDFGNMQFDPDWITVEGQPADVLNNIPHLSVQYQYRKLNITSDSADIEEVVLKFSTGDTVSYQPPPGTTQFLAEGIGYRIVHAWIKAGDNEDPGTGLGEEFDFEPETIDDTIRIALGLDGQDYNLMLNPTQDPSDPDCFGDGSWNEYIDYIQGRNNDNDDAGYRYKFGYLNFMNYLNRYNPRYWQSCVLWRTSQQPATALKNSVSIFYDSLQKIDVAGYEELMTDRTALAVYNDTDDMAKLEFGLTKDFQPVEDTVWARQAAHYGGGTNIGAGIQAGRLELEANARVRVDKVIILMTDGRAGVNQFGNSDEASAKQFAIDESILSAASDITIHTISVGAKADTDLMQAIANNTGGIAYVIPGAQSQTVAEYQAAIEAAFREIVFLRRPTLVQ